MYNIQYPMTNHMAKNIKKEGIEDVYNWVTILYSRDWHNIVNQLYFNKKKKKKEDYYGQGRVYDPLYAFCSLLNLSTWKSAQLAVRTW